MSTLSPQPSGARPAPVARPIEVRARNAHAVGVACVRWQVSIDPKGAGTGVELPVGTRIVSLRVDLTSRMIAKWVDSTGHERVVQGEWENANVEWRSDNQHHLTHIDAGQWLRVTLDAHRRVLYAGGHLIRHLGILGGRLGVPEAVSSGSPTS